MASYPCCPTPNTYVWLFSQGTDAELLVAFGSEDLQLDFDEVTWKARYCMIINLCQPLSAASTYRILRRGTVV